MGQRPSPYDRPMMGRGSIFGPGPGRGGAGLDQMRSGSGYSGGMLLGVQPYSAVEFFLMQNIYVFFTSSDWYKT